MGNNVWGTFGLTIAATLIGAYAAFSLERWQRKWEKNQERNDQANRVIIQLFELWNFFISNHNVMTSILTDPENWLEIQAPIQASKNFDLDVSGLEYLFSAKDKNVIPELLLIERRFKNLNHNLQRWVSLRIDKINPILANQNFTIGKNYHFKKLEESLPQDLAYHGKILSQDCLKYLEMDISSLRTTYSRFKSAVKESLPKAKLLNLSFSPPKKYWYYGKGDKGEQGTAP